MGLVLKVFERTLPIGLFLALNIQCIDPYNAPTSQTNLAYLVVDGFLNGTTRVCNVSLSRSVPLSHSKPPPTETGAVVILEGANGANFPLPEIKAGQYGASNLSINPGDNVSLFIRLKNKTEFRSDVVVMYSTPEIDSVTFVSERSGANVFVNSHHDSNQSMYFSWKYTETWAYKAGFETGYKLDANLNFVPLTENIYQCWNTDKSTSILTGVSSILEDNTGVVSRSTIAVLPWESPKIQDRYSILVEQRSISKQTFDYLQLLKKNTENLGTLFDPLPFEPITNIRCITQPGVITLGNFSASTVQEKRIFFNQYELNRPEGTRSVTGYEGCTLVEITMPFSDWQIYVPVWMGSNSVPAQGTMQFCVDCRLKGGTNVKPDFWVW